MKSRTLAPTLALLLFSSASILSSPAEVMAQEGQDPPAESEEAQTDTTEEVEEVGEGTATFGDVPSVGDVPEGNVVETIAPRPPDASDETSGIQEISREELREQGAPSVLDALAKRAPWLYATTDGSGTYGIGPGSTGDQSLRGAGGPPASARTLTVWDGIPDLNGAVGRPLPDFYVDALLESVQLAPGGDSVRWGTNAMNGVIALRSRWRETEGWETEVGGGGGSYGQLRADAAVLGNVKGWAISAAVTRRTSEGALDYSEDSVSTAQVAARKRGNWGMLTTRLRYGYLDGKNAGNGIDLATNNWYNSERGTGSIEYLGQIGKMITGRLVLFGSMGRDRLYTGSALDDRQLGARSELFVTPVEWITVAFGLAIDHVEADLLRRPDNIEEEVEPTSTSAPWTEITLRPIKRVTIVTGGRYVFGLEGDGIPLYKAGVVVDAWKSGKVRARVSRNYSQPTIAQRFLLPAANPGLQSEVSRNAEVGISQYFGEKFEARALVYQLSAENYIQPTGVRPNVEFQNVGEAEQWGVEGNAILTPVRWVEIGAAGAWSDVGEITAQNPNLRLGGWGTMRWKDLRGTVNLNYIDGRYQRNNSETPLDPITDLGANVSWRPDPRFEIYARGNNLLDLPNSPLPGFGSIGRNYFVGFRARLDSAPE